MLIITPLLWKEVSHPNPLHSIIWPVLLLKLIHRRSVSLMAKIMIYFGRMTLIRCIFRIKRRYLDKSTVHTPQISNMENQLMAQMIWIIQPIRISKRWWRITMISNTKSSYQKWKVNIWISSIVVDIQDISLSIWVPKIPTMTNKMTTTKVFNLIAKGKRA